MQIYSGVTMCIYEANAGSPQDRGSPLVQGPASADLSILGGVLRNRVPCFMTSHQVLASC